VPKSSSAIRTPVSLIARSSETGRCVRSSRPLSVISSNEVGRVEAGVGERARDHAGEVGLLELARGDFDRDRQRRRRAERRVPEREALDQAEREQPGDVEPQQVDHPAMALPPALVGKGLALRQEVAQMRMTPHRQMFDSG
jgi:hypothetical protein